MDELWLSCPPPTGVTSIIVSTNTNFKGSLDADPTTGVVRVTNAHPAGAYVVSVNASGPSGTTVRTFLLTVTTPSVCDPPSFTFAADFGAGVVNGDRRSRRNETDVEHSLSCHAARSRRLNKCSSCTGAIYRDIRVNVKVTTGIGVIICRDQSLGISSRLKGYDLRSG